MKKRIMEKLIMIILTISFSLFVLSSCEKESEDSTKKDITKVDTPQNDTIVVDNNNVDISEEEKEEKSTDDSSNSEEKYIIRGWTTYETLPRYAGSKIGCFMTYNGPWRAFYDGNITGFSFTPSEGIGDITIKMSFAETKYVTSKSEISWNESGTMTFYIRTGTKSNWTEEKRSFKIYRRGSKMNI